jgi:sec-independent protein translocase protein TatC
MSAEPENTSLEDTLPENTVPENILTETPDSAAQNIADPDVQLWSPPDDLADDLADDLVLGASVLATTDDDDTEVQLWEPTEAEILASEDTEAEAEPELPHEVEMSFFDHLEELRTRIFYALIAVVVGALGCFTIVRQLVALLEVPAQGVKFLQLTPGEYFFVSIKVAGYGGILVATPVILYQVIQFVLPGLTKRERRLVLPVVVGSSFLFVGGLLFAYYLLIPAALNFLVSYGADVVEQFWSIERYFEFILVLLLATGLVFQVPVVQILLALLGIVTSGQMLRSWRTVVVSAMVVGAVVTPSTDPITQSLLAGAILGLYFGGVGCVKLLGK